MSLTANIASGLTALAIKDEGVSSVLTDYVSELLKWNKVYNLTALQTPLEIVSRHIIDSLSIYRFVTGNTILDVGSGGGFPGIPLALVHTDKQFILLDANGKKVRFLQQMVINLGLSNCTVQHCRVEMFTGQFDQITCRAFASLLDMIEKTLHLLTQAGEILAMKARLNLAEIQAINSAFSVHTYPLVIPFIESERHLVVLKRVGV